MTNYWHVNTSIPSSVANELKELACGEDVGNDLLKVNSEVFKSIFEINRKYLYRGDCTAPSNEHNYANNRNYITGDGLSGFSITNNGWIISIFSNNKDNKILEKLSKFINSNSKIVVISGKDWNKSHLILRYINNLSFRPIAVTLDSLKEMTSKYGKEYMDNFTSVYGKQLTHVFLIKDSAGGNNTDIKQFEHFKDAFDYTENYLR